MISQLYTRLKKSQFQTGWNPKILIFFSGIPKSQIGLPGPISGCISSSNRRKLLVYQKQKRVLFATFKATNGPNFLYFMPKAGVLSVFLGKKTRNEGKSSLSSKNRVFSPSFWLLLMVYLLQKQLPFWEILHTALLPWDYPPPQLGVFYLTKMRGDTLIKW